MFDLDAVVQDTAAEPFRFTWGKETFELPAILDLPLDRQLAIIDAVETIQGADPKQLARILNLIIGEDLLARLSAARPLSAAVLMKLIQAWTNSQGSDLGKSPASSASSASTARPSKATSRSGRARKTS